MYVEKYKLYSGFNFTWASHQSKGDAISRKKHSGVNGSTGQVAGGQITHYMPLLLNGRNKLEFSLLLGTLTIYCIHLSVYDLYIISHAYGEHVYTKEVHGNPCLCQLISNRNLLVVYICLKPIVTLVKFIFGVYNFPLCFMFQLLSLYSPVFKELFSNAEKGVTEELPVVKLENESATDIRALLDMFYPNANQVVNGMST